jgi:hypothetical protein
MAATNTHVTIKKLLEAVFSVRPLLRLHNEGQQPLLLSREGVLRRQVRRIGGWREMVEAEERLLLEGITDQSSEERD